jgi:hypothetical protein
LTKRQPTSVFVATAIAFAAAITRVFAIARSNPFIAGGNGCIDRS